MRADDEFRRGLTGHDVVDTQMVKVGTVTDVLYDERDASARWAIVKTSAVGGEHIVPLDDTYLDQVGRLVVSFDKATVRRAPRARRDHTLTLEVRRALRDFYAT